MPTIDEVKSWRGETVVDRDGDKLGKVEDIYLDRQTDQPEWVAVKTGMIGSKLSFVPLAGAERSGDEIRVPYEKG
jgi:sporulation protein YlmC with PRC-barrel domain